MELFIENLKNIREPNETLITICVSKMPIVELVEYFENQINKTKNITNQKVRTILSDRLTRWLNTIRQQTGSMDALFFIGDEAHRFHLTPRHNELVQEFKLYNPYYKTDFMFQADFFQNFFCNDKFYIMISLEKKLNIYYYNPSKEKKIVINVPSDLQKEIELYEKDANTVGIYTVGVKDSKWNQLPRVMSKKEFLDYLELQSVKKNNQELEKRLNEMQINPDLFVFGRLKFEMLEAIESYQLKELFIDEKKLEKLKMICDASYLNFKIFPIKSLQTNDVADRFIKDYKGLMGIKYF